jgi:heptosyltransferase II
MGFNPQRCLIVGPSWVGDMVMAQSLFMVLKAQFPGLLIDVLAPGWSAPLLARMPEVNAAIEMPLGHGALQLGARYRLGKSLRSTGYDWAIVLPNSWKSALVPFWANIPRRTGYIGEQRYGLLNDRRKLDKQKLVRTVQRFVALGQARDADVPLECPNPALSVAGEQARLTAEKYGLDAGRPILALAPGAEYGPAKRWPAEYFAEVAAALEKQGFQIIILGSERDQEPAAKIAGYSGAIDLAGKTSLGEAVDLLSLVSVTVTNDSGLMHIAAATGSAVVAIYGSSDPGFTPPMTDRARILRLELECSPCFKRDCPLGHTACLVELRPERVINAVEELVS